MNSLGSYAFAPFVADFYVSATNSLTQVQVKTTYYNKVEKVFLSIVTSFRKSELLILATRRYDKGEEEHFIEGAIGT